MANTRVVDTNVLIVASAADNGSPFRPEATPVEEASLRQLVLDWLIAFELDPARKVVLDYDWLLCSEYQNKLTEQDYGWLVIMGKQDRNEVAWVGVSQDDHGHGLLPLELAEAVSDLEDRKMVAATLAALNDQHVCKLTNACDTDWLDCSKALRNHGIEVEHLIEDWLQKKWHVKKSR